jgi:proline dehydrogenase
MGLMRTVLLWSSRNEWMRDHVPSFPFVRRAVTRFMPGEDAEAALAAAASYQQQGMGIILTQLGENVTTLDEAEAETRLYLDLLDNISGAGLDAEISVKLTHIGLDLGVAVAYENLARLVARAGELGNYVWVDMEASDYVDVTLEIYEKARGAAGNVGLCIQSYLRRSAMDLDRLGSLEPGIRLVKGAYQEPPSVAFRRKADVDRAFARQADQLLDRASEGRARVGLGTHDIGLVDRIISRADVRGIPRGAYEIQMLYGIRSADQQRYAADGRKVRVLISYGEGWYPWYVRRLAERPANLGFLIRNIFRR